MYVLTCEKGFKLSWLLLEGGQNKSFPKLLLHAKYPALFVFAFFRKLFPEVVALT